MAGGKIMRVVKATKGLTSNQKDQARRIAKAQVSRLQDKRHFNEAGPVDCSSTVVITDLTTMTRGNAEGNFSGDDIQMKGWEFRYNIRAVSSQTEPSCARFIIFQWKMDDTDEIPVASDILYNTATDPHVSHYEVTNKFKVLKDVMVNLQENHVGGVTSKSGLLKGYKGFNKRITFKSGVSTGKNKIYLLSMGDLATPNSINLEYHFRLHYVD